MPFIHHDQGTDNAERVAERILHHWKHTGIAIKVGGKIERGFVRLLLAFRRKEAVNVAPVFKHFQIVLVRASG